MDAHKYRREKFTTLRLFLAPLLLLLSFFAAPTVSQTAMVIQVRTTQSFQTICIPFGTSGTISVSIDWGDASAAQNYSSAVPGPCTSVSECVEFLTIFGQLIACRSFRVVAGTLLLSLTRFAHFDIAILYQTRFSFCQNSLDLFELRQLLLRCRPCLVFKKEWSIFIRQQGFTLFQSIGMGPVLFGCRRSVGKIRLILAGIRLILLVFPILGF